MSIFNSILVKKPKRSMFNLSHERKLSLNMGKLVPTMVQEVLPGDSFRVSSNNLVRMHPLVAPIMHRIDVFTHYFYVPNRLVWQDWEKYISNSHPELNLTLPTITFDNTNKGYTGDGGLADYLGVPNIKNIDLTNDLKVNALPFRAYQLIFDEFYRDQDLQNSINVPTDSTENFFDMVAMRSRSWQKDYFTSARPWAQKGADVMLPMSINPGQRPQAIKEDGSTATGDLIADQGEIYAGSNSPGNQVRFEDVATVTAPNITELRRATKLQEWLEKNARAGSRYIEQLLVHFGVMSDDARLHRPEYLGGGRQAVQISEVANTSDTSNAPQGNLSGEGTSMGKSGFSKAFKEHGFIIGITSIMPKPAYMNGLPRMFSKNDIFDFAFPEFANIGEQPILNKELFVTGTELDNETFGYTPRYAEYKFTNDSVHGDFKSTLKHWHLSREFSNTPSLNEEFIKYNFGEDQKKIFPVTDDTHKFYMQIYNDIKAVRPLPYFSDPSF